MTDVRESAGWVIMRTGNKREGRECPVVGRLLFALYGILGRRLRKCILKLVRRLEGGELYSLTLRRIFREYHQIDVGLYTGGGSFVEGNFRSGHPGAKIGRYCSCAYTARAFNANHPMNLRSSHAIFYNPALGYAKRDLLTRTRLEIGNDVWLGDNAIILSSVSSIGDGAVIGAGAVVHQDVPPYAIAVGNPARVVRYRFSPGVIQELQELRWWEKPLDELLPEFESFQQPLEGEEVR